MLHNLTIGRRMTLLVMAGAGAILVAIVSFSATNSRRLLKAELEAKARAIAEATASRIEGTQRSVESTARGLAVNLEEDPRPVEQIIALLYRTVGSSEDVFGSAVALPPGAFGPAHRGAAPYVYRTEAGLAQADLSKYGYAYQTWDWYTLPKELGRPVWSEPYYDEGGGNTLMATYSVPLFGGPQRDRFLGVVTCDVSLQWLTRLLSDLPLGEKGYAYLISKNGTLITHPTPGLIMNESLFSLAEENRDPALRALGRRMIRGEQGFLPYREIFSRQPAYLAFTPVRTSGWSLGVVFPKRAVDRAVQVQMAVQIALGVAGLGLLFLVVLSIARTITGPLKRLAEATQTLAKGDLDTPLPRVGGEDEVAHLAQSFAAMQRDLKAHVEELKETTAKKERMEKELQIAKSIQQSLVPRTFPPYAGREDFELYAVLDPARQIGGDLYDFLLLDEDHFCISIGDVSGKGIPAALFMAVSRTLLRRIVKETPDDTAEVVRRLNGELSSENESMMFVTLFCAVVDLSTGKCRYTNGGHCPPFILRNSGEVERIPSVGGLIVGVLPEAAYKAAEFQLEPGESIFFYTDGLTEAKDPDDELYEEERLLMDLRELRGLKCEELVREMRDRIYRFARGAEQSDDITLMAFTYMGPRKK